MFSRVFVLWVAIYIKNVGKSIHKNVSSCYLCEIIHNFYVPHFSFSVLSVFLVALIYYFYNL